jgi:hypothetical protein
MESREDHSIFETAEDERYPRMLLAVVKTMKGFTKLQVTNGTTSIYRSLWSCHPGFPSPAHVNVG